MAEKNEVFIGKKPFMNYVTAAVMQFNSGSKKIVIKARGKYISRAVDVAEVVKNRFVKDIKVDEVKIGSDDFESNGRTIRTSTIEIYLKK